MKFGIILTVRLQSLRLRNKAIFKLNNVSMIEQIIKRLKKTSISKNIVLCTSAKKENFVFKKICKKNDVKFFYGDENDVAKRIYDAAVKYKIENIICCTGDNPFTELNTIEKIKIIQKKKNYDFIQTEGLPWGSFCYVVKKNSLKRVLEIKDTKNTEVWFDYLIKNMEFKKLKLRINDKSKKYPNLRLTVDYYQDYILANIIYLLLQDKKKIIDFNKVIELYKKHPNIFKINNNIKQKKYKKIKIKSEYFKLYN
jgi:spore coat polysaccharide biosynthesis protein SpsF